MGRRSIKLLVEREKRSSKDMYNAKNCPMEWNNLLYFNRFITRTAIREQHVEMDGML